MEIRDFQRAAALSSTFRVGGPQAAVEPMLGLASETGSILNVYKKYLRDGIDLAANREFLLEELGDLLWYTAAVATACGLDLEEIAQANLKRARERYIAYPLEELPVFDEGFPVHERFPRHLIVEFREYRQPDGRLAATMRVVDAIPEPRYEQIGELSTGKRVGFKIGADLGDPLTDNAHQPDAYRFHDSIHLGFMAVLGWSPNLRSLLRLKRKSRPSIDEVEDGARSIFAEEGLAAVLAQLSKRRSGFQKESNIDGEVIDVVKAGTAGLEVDVMPASIWQQAICHGFRCMHQLDQHGGGYLIADLDTRRLTYEKILSSARESGNVKLNLSPEEKAVQ